MALPQFMSGAEYREAEGSRYFQEREREKRLDAANAIAREAEALTLEYQRSMGRLAAKLQYETNINTSDYGETIDSHLYDLMGDTFGAAVRELEDA